MQLLRHLWIQGSHQHRHSVPRLWQQKSGTITMHRSWTRKQQKPVIQKGGPYVVNCMSMHQAFRSLGSVSSRSYTRGKPLLFRKKKYCFHCGLCPTSITMFPLWGFSPLDRLALFEAHKMTKGGTPPHFEIAGRHSWADRTYPQGTVELLLHGTIQIILAAKLEQRPERWKKSQKAYASLLNLINY